VTAQLNSPISAAGSTTFNIQFDASCPSTAGTYNAVVSVTSDDADESPYTFTIEADITGVDTDSDGVLHLCVSDDDGKVDGSDPDCDGICDATDPTGGASQGRMQMLTFSAATTDYVSIGNAPELDFGKGDDFTVEAWINSASVSTAMQIISKCEGDLSSAPGGGFQISGSSLAFYMAGASFLDLMVSVPTGAPNVKDGLWHHVVVVYDGSNNVTGCTFYIDGVAYAGVAGGGLVTTVAGTVTNGESAAIGAYLGAISGAGEHGAKITLTLTQQVPPLEIITLDLMMSQALASF
jgi:hypothetical protein